MIAGRTGMSSMKSSVRRAWSLIGFKTIPRSTTQACVALLLLSFSFSRERSLIDHSTPHHDVLAIGCRKVRMSFEDIR